LTPPFGRTPRDPGYIRAYPPGVRENGGQYTHAAAWLGLAHARLANGDEAYRCCDDVENASNHPFVVRRPMGGA
jgi:cyclic beta-1,2-glucan synthetase